LIPHLLPPSSGGTASVSNDNDGEAHSELTGEADEEGQEDDVPATVRDPQPWGDAAPTAEWCLLEEGAERVV
jgi:hypothetical protein